MGHKEVAEILISSSDIDVNKQDQLSFTTLSIAAHYSDNEVKECRRVPGIEKKCHKSSGALGKISKANYLLRQQ